MAEWSGDEQANILAEYVRHGIAFCPMDDDLLTETRAAHRGGPNAVVLTCPTCGRWVPHQGADAT